MPHRTDPPSQKKSVDRTQWDLRAPLVPMGNVCSSHETEGGSSGTALDGSSKIDQSFSSNWPDNGVALPEAFELKPAPTRTQLEQIRDEFFDTRTEGNQEMWAAIRSASEAFRGGDAVLGNEIIKASGLIPAEVGANGDGVGVLLAGSPTGSGENARVADVSQQNCVSRSHVLLRTLERVYDERGFLYETPKFCLVDPVNVVDAS